MGPTFMTYLERLPNNKALRNYKFGFPQKTKNKNPNANAKASNAESRQADMYHHTTVNKHVIHQLDKAP